MLAGRYEDINSQSQTCNVVVDALFQTFSKRISHNSNCPRGLLNGGVPLELTLQLTLQLLGRMQKSGTKIHKKGREKSGSASPPRQDLIQPGLSGSRG